MKLKGLLVDFVITFLATLIVSSLVSLIYNLIFHSNSSIEWETAFRFAIILGIILPWLHYRERKQQGN